MGIDGLEQAQNDPEVDGGNVKVLGEITVHQRAKNSSSTEDEDFSRVSIFGGQTKRSRVFVMNLVDVLVKDTGVKSLVG